MPAKEKVWFLFFIAEYIHPTVFLRVLIEIRFLSNSRRFFVQELLSGKAYRKQRQCEITSIYRYNR
jgi:hypothetical protein